MSLFFEGQNRDVKISVKTIEMSIFSKYWAKKIGTKKLQE